MAGIDQIFKPVKDNAAIIKNFYAASDPNKPDDREKRLGKLKIADKAVVIAAMKRIHATAGKFDYAIRDMMELEDEEENPLYVLKDLYKNKCSKGKLPAFVVNHFRSYHAAIPRSTMVIAPRSNGKKDHEREYRNFLETYEKIQNGSRQTLNKMISWALDRQEYANSLALLLDCKVAESTKSPLIECSIIPEDSTIKANIELSKEFIEKYLLYNEAKTMIDKITRLSSEARDSNTYGEGIKGLQDDLKLFRANISRLVIRHSILHKDNSFNKVSNMLIGKNSDIVDPLERVDSILQILQGMAIVLFKWPQRFICLVTRETPKKDFSYVGQQFCLMDNNSRYQEETDPDMTSLMDCLRTGDFIQRVLSRELFLRQRPGDPSVILQNALGSKDAAQKFEECISTRLYNYDVLGGVISLANCLRPIAIHEGKELVINFIVGSMHLFDNALERVSALTNEQALGTGLEPMRVKKAIIEWDNKSDANLESENEKLLEARSCILGNCQLLQKSDVALFVDTSYDRNKIGCTHLVKMIPPRWSTHEAGYLIDFTKENKSLFLVRVQGHRRIEIWQNGKKRLVWSDITARWQSEPTWDQESVKTAIEDSLFRNKKDRTHETTRYIDRVCETISLISQAHGEGASFVVYRGSGTSRLLEDIEKNVGEMTVAFPGMGNGALDKISSEELKDVAVQDGGTLVDLNGWFLGRQQWLPTSPVINRPFNYLKAKVSEKAFKEIQNPRNKIERRKIEDLRKDSAFKLKISPLIKTISSEEIKKSTTFDLTNFWKYDFININGNFYWNMLRWQQWYNVYKWGTRHVSALGMSHSLFDEALVINISADGPISVFFCGRAVERGQKPFLHHKQHKKVAL